MFPRLLLLFITVPLIELVLLFTVGAEIGFGATLAIIVVTAIIGASLTKTQGAAVLAKAQLATQEGRVPHAEVLDGLMIVLAGAVLLTPGFLTDVFGFSLLFPPFRAVVRKGLVRAFKNRVQIVGPGGMATAQQQRSPSRGDDDVIEAEVIDVD